MPGSLSTYVAITDWEWFDFLSRSQGIDEANFWQPNPSSAFRALKSGEPFLFKLHSPNNFIVGGGYFVYWTTLPVSLAWQTFGAKNGAQTLSEMRTAIERYRRIRSSPAEDYKIGCILLAQPFFLPRKEWIRISDWHSNIVRGRRYDLASEPGRALWESVLARLPEHTVEPPAEQPLVALPEARYGLPTIAHPRLGQGLFRVLVTDAYQRRCAITGERVLPVLEAAHIHRYSLGGEHRVDNGLLLRSDLHTLFDRGYVTVTPEYRVEVSTKLKTDFDNGKEYLAWQGRQIGTPGNSSDQPSKRLLQWHNEHCFVG